MENRKKIKIIISGIGAVGGFYGGMLAAYYEHSDKIEIVFISRGENLKKIKEEGLRIEMPDKTVVARPALVTDNPLEAGICDFLFCCTKYYDLDENITDLYPVIGKQTILLPLLNGVDIADHIEKRLPHNAVWEGCVYVSARLKEPGVVSLFSKKEMLFFGGGMQPDKQKELLGILTSAGIHAINPSDITLRIWKKFFMISIAATITSYYDENVGDALRLHREDFETLGKELFHVARSKGVVLPSDIIEKSIESQSMMPKDSTTSMHSDFKKGKRTELEALTGYVVHSAEKMGITVPLYRRMYESLQNR